MRKLNALLIGALLLSAHVPAQARTSETLKLSVSDLGAVYQILAAETQKTQTKLKKVNRLRAINRNPAARLKRNALPEICENLPVVYIRNGDIYKNGTQIGRSARNYKANCDGHVAWTDSHSDLHLDKKEISRNASNYDIAWYGDTVVWKDSHGDLHKLVDGSEKEYDRVSSYTFLRYTGDVVYKNSWGDLYRDNEKFGRVSSYKVAQRTGDVAWRNSYGDLYKNHKKLGRSSNFAIADRTGDVAWKGSYGDLYKNTKKVARNPSSWQLREDGVLIWRDSRGHYHYE